MQSCLWRLGGLAELGVLWIVSKVMADIEVQVTIAVEVSEGGRGWPIAIAGQAGRARHILKPPVTSVAIECVRMPARDKQVGSAIVVVVAHGDSMTVPPRKRADARAVGDVFKGAVAAIAKQPVAVAPDCLVRWKRPSLHGVNVEPAISIVVEQSDPSAHRFGGNKRTIGMPVRMNETKAGAFSRVGERGQGQWVFLRPGDSQT